MLHAVADTFLEHSPPASASCLNSIEATDADEGLPQAVAATGRRTAGAATRAAETNEQLEQKAQQMAERNVEVERKNQEIEQARRALEERRRAGVDLKSSRNSSPTCRTSCVRLNSISSSSAAWR